MKEVDMPIRARKHTRLFWPYCHYGGWYPFPHSPPPLPWWLGKLTPEDEKRALREDIEMLKEEIKAAGERIKELEEAA